MTQRMIKKAMESGSLKQRNVVGVITGLMGSGKTTLLHRLFGTAPPELYTSTGVAEQSFRGFLHHTVRMSADGTWQRITYEDIRKYLAPLIKAGMTKEKVDTFAQRILHSSDLSPTMNRTPSPSPAVSSPLPITVMPEHSKVENAESHMSKEMISLVSETPPSENSSDLVLDLGHRSHSEEEYAESHMSKEMVSLVLEAPPSEKSSDLVLDLVHMIDTGGQPELMEVMPSLIHNANLAMVLVNLKYGLNERLMLDYHEEGVQYQRPLSQCYITTKDVILKLASTLNAKRSAGKNFRILVVATHRDCMEDDLEARERDLNQQLSTLLLPSFEEELIMFKFPNKIAFVLNLKKPNEHDRDTLKLIRDVVSSPNLGPEPFETPASFFAFEQDLLHYAETIAKRDILTFNECRQVGEKLGMDNDMIVAALVLFHWQNIFLYFPKVLPNHVFIKPQVPLDIVNSIVRFSYKPLCGVPAKVTALLRDGIITEELLGYNDVSPHFKTGIYEIHEAIKLFSHTFTLAPLQLNASEVDRKKKRHLMMCLKPAKTDAELQHYIPHSTSMVPLAIKFSIGCVPLGCFSSTISCLISKYGWKVVLDNNVPKCLAHNIACLHDPDLLVRVVLVDFSQYIEVHIDSDLPTPMLANVCNQLRRRVFESIEKVFERMMLDQNEVEIKPAIVCPYTQKHHHLAEFVKNILWCEKCSKSCEADPKQLLWMGEDTASQPDLPELLRLKVPENAGVYYTKFGTLLLDDKRGCHVKNIEKSNKEDPELIVINILRNWLTREPTPVTWENLIKTLRESDLKRLAEDIICKRQQQQV